MLSAYRSLAAGEERELAIRPWLYRIAHNQCVTMLRRRPAHPTQPLTGSEVLPAQAVAERIETAEELSRLRQDLLALPHDQRGALVLRELSGLSHAQIAEVLNESAASVKQLDLPGADRAVRDGRGAHAPLRHRSPAHLGWRRQGAALSGHGCPPARLYPVPRLPRGHRGASGILGGTDPGPAARGGEPHRHGPARPRRGRCGGWRGWRNGHRGRCGCRGRRGVGRSGRRPRGEARGGDGHHRHRGTGAHPHIGRH